MRFRGLSIRRSAAVVASVMLVLLSGCSADEGSEVPGSGAPTAKPTPSAASEHYSFAAIGPYRQNLELIAWDADSAGQIVGNLTTVSWSDNGTIDRDIRPLTGIQQGDAVEFVNNDEWGSTKGTIEGDKLILDGDFYVQETELVATDDAAFEKMVRDLADEQTVEPTS